MKLCSLETGRRHAKQNKTKAMPPYHVKQKTYLTRASHPANLPHQPCLFCLHTPSRLHNVPHYKTGKAFFQQSLTDIIPNIRSTRHSISSFHNILLSLLTYIRLKEAEDMPNKIKTMPPYHVKRKTYLTRACHAANSLHQHQPCLFSSHNCSRLHNVPHYNTGKAFFQHSPTDIIPNI